MCERKKVERLELQVKHLSEQFELYGNQIDDKDVLKLKLSDAKLMVQKVQKEHQSTKDRLEKENKILLNRLADDTIKAALIKSQVTRKES